jgi:squalene-associated FAD-dependent desaturase
VSGGGPARAFVLGGGVAGLCAAFHLRDRGHAVTLLESHGWLGGRAFSFPDQRTGERLDNGPHVMLGCYRAMRQLLERIGSTAGFAQERALAISYRTAAGRSARLQLARLPVPVAFGPALRRVPLGLGGFMRLLRGAISVVRGAPADWTVADWLARCGQQGAPARFFWVPMCRSIMNVGPEDASAKLFLRTLREAFTGSAAAAAFWLPSRPWGELIGDAAAVQLQREGIGVRSGARVQGLQCAGGRIIGIALGTGEVVAVGERALVVSAMPWSSLAQVLDSPQPFASLQPSPIVSAHFRLQSGGAEAIDEAPLIALVDGDPFHFLFRAPGAPREHFAVLAGGNRAFDGMSVAAIEEAARSQLARHFPGFQAAAEGFVRVAKEARATIVPSVGAAGLRPRPGRLDDGPGNLLVCGDWTDCGLPSTLEGAARSAAMALRD